MYLYKKCTIQNTFSRTLPCNWRCSTACKTIGGTCGVGGLSADCLSIRHDAEAEEDRSVRASISRDFQLDDSVGWSLPDKVLLSLFWFEFSLDDLELCERLDPDECRLTFGDSSGTSWLPVEFVEEIDGVLSLTFLCPFFNSEVSITPWDVTALWRGIAKTPFSVIQFRNHNNLLLSHVHVPSILFIIFGCNS